MISLIKLIEQNIESHISRFINQICDKYDNVDKEDIIYLWKNLDNSEKKNTEISKLVKDKKTETKITTETNNNVTKKISDTKGTGCPYEYTKGDKKGQKCGVKSKNGSEYCSTHKKYEGKELKEPKFLPQPIKSDSSTSAKRAELHPSLKVYYHKETSLVFKSPKELIIVAKIVNKNIKSISTEEDIELCKKYGFKYTSNFDLKLIETKKDMQEDEEDTPKPLLRKVESKKKEEQIIKTISPIEKISEVEENIKQLNIKDFKDAQSFINKAMGCDEPEFSDTD